MVMAGAKQNIGFSLSELLVVIAVISLLVGIGVPVAKEMIASFESPAATAHIISAALANARAMAIANGKYTGVRFQQDTTGRQYMIFIENDSSIGPWLAGNLGCRVIEGRKPIKLPATVGVMDLKVKDGYDVSVPVELEKDIASDGDIVDDYTQLRDTTTFSILFSKAGKLVVRNMRVRNRDDYSDTDPLSQDQVFNTVDQVDDEIGMFYQDDYPDRGLQKLELSRNNFVIYDKKVLPDTERWTGYLQYLKVMYVNPYTGKIIK